MCIGEIADVDVVADAAAIGKDRMGAAEHLIEQGPIAHLAHHQRHPQHILHRGPVAVHQVVEHHRLGPARCRARTAWLPM